MSLTNNIITLPQEKTLIEWFHWLSNHGFYIKEHYGWVSTDTGLGVQFFKESHANSVRSLMVLKRNT